jgi:hypothetical protein
MLRQPTLSCSWRESGALGVLLNTRGIARLASCDLADELCSARTTRQVRLVIERIESLW